MHIQTIKQKHAHNICKKKTQKNIVILKFSMKLQTKLKYESNLKHSST
jgi:hypothetical protein